MTKYLRISPFIRKPFLIYDFAPDPFWISLYMKKNLFSFLTVHCIWLWDEISRVVLAVELGSVKMNCAMFTLHCWVGHLVLFFQNELSSRLYYMYSLVFTAKTQYRTENSIQIFPEKELCGLSPNFYIHVSVIDLYISTICLPILR